MVRGTGRHILTSCARGAERNERNGAERLGAERRGVERSGAERIGADRIWGGAERSEAKRSGAERSGAERSGREQSRGHMFPECFQGVSWGVSEVFLRVPGVS